MFGMIGMIIGPVIAALFVTVWDIYGIEFKEVLPEVKIFQCGFGQLISTLKEWVKKRQNAFCSLPGI